MAGWILAVSGEGNGPLPLRTTSPVTGELSTQPRLEKDTNWGGANRVATRTNQPDPILGSSEVGPAPCGNGKSRSDCKQTLPRTAHQRENKLANALPMPMDKNTAKLWRQPLNCSDRRSRKRREPSRDLDQRGPVTEKMLSSTAQLNELKHQDR